MLTMQRDPIKISWDELSSDKVEAKLKRLDAINKAREQFDKPVATQPLHQTSRFPWFYNTLVYMSIFGALGGLVGFAFGEIMNFRPNQRLEAERLKQDYNEYLVFIQQNPNDAIVVAGLQEIVQAGRHNEYFTVYVDANLTSEQKDAKTAEIASRDQWKDFIANMLFFGISGMMISVALSSAESVVSRNARGAILDGSVGAALGLVGGVVIAVFFNDILAFTVQYLGADSFNREILVSSVTWGIMGLFIATAPGILLRNGKRLLIGMAGGLVGGLIGGALYEPIKRQFDLADMGGLGEHVSRLVAIVSIGLIAGFGTGLLENVAKNGWIKVKEGLIAGKQFVLYRNPTYIGSAPNCHVYLFKDPRVGRRHAAIHVVPGGFEIEDLPLGERTQVNGRTVSRTRLKNGDKIQVGSTLFEFHEKARAQTA
jgi:hypothetical protein